MCVASGNPFTVLSFSIGVVSGSTAYRSALRHGRLNLGALQDVVTPHTWPVQSALAGKSMDGKRERCSASLRMFSKHAALYNGACAKS